MNVSTDAIRELLPDYASGTLEPELMNAVDAYLGEHRELLDQVTAMEDAFAMLALAAQPARPPASAKHDLLHRIELDSARRRLAAPAAPQSTPESRTKTATGRWRMPELVKTMTAVAAAVTILAFAAMSLLLSRELSLLNARSERQQAQIASLESQVADYAAVVETLNTTIADLQTQREQLVAQAQQLAGDNSALTTRIQEIDRELALDQSRLQLLSTAEEAVMLDQGEAAPQSRGAFYVSGPQGVLIVHGLEPLPPSQVYQFWWVTPDGTQVPVAPVEVSVGVEPTWAVFDVPQQAPAFSVVGLSIEPAGGSPQPTGPMVLEGAITG